MVFQGIQVAAVTFEKAAAAGFVAAATKSVTMRMLFPDRGSETSARLGSITCVSVNPRSMSACKIPLRTKFLCKRQRLGNGVNRRSIHVEHVLRLVTEGRRHVVVMTFKERIHKMAVMIAVLIKGDGRRV